MSIRWTIIDGNNLVHADPALAQARAQDFQSARQVLVRRLEAVCGQAEGRVTVVFDSRTPKAFTGFEGSGLAAALARGFAVAFDAGAAFAAAAGARRARGAAGAASGASGAVFAARVFRVVLGDLL